MSPTFYKAESYRRDESLGWLLKTLKQSIAFQADLRLSKEGLTHAQWVPLLTVHLSGPCSMAQLVRELESDAGATTRLLDRLEAKGLCRRERSIEDRRVVMVQLTEEGQRISTELTAVLADVFNAHLQGFSEQEWRTWLSLTQRLLANGEALRQAAQTSGQAAAAQAEPSSDT